MPDQRLLKLVDTFRNEAKEYRRMEDHGEPVELRKEWGGVARGLERAATVLTAEAWQEEHDAEKS